MNYKINVFRGGIKENQLKTNIMKLLKSDGYDIKESDFGEVEMSNKNKNFVHSIYINLDERYSRGICKKYRSFWIHNVRCNIFPDKINSFKAYIDFDEDQVSVKDINVYDVMDYVHECGATTSFYKKNEEHNSISAFFFDEVDAYLVKDKLTKVLGYDTKFNPEWSEDIEDMIKNVTKDYLVPVETFDSMKKLIPDLFNVKIDSSSFLNQ